MALSSRQLGFLFLLLVPHPTMAGFLDQLVQFSESREMYESALLGLVSGPLRGQDLLLVSDDHSQRLLDVDQVVAEAGTSLTPIYLATQHSLLHTTQPTRVTKGSLLTALILFHNDPTAFLLLLESNKNWNPSYVILFCLDQNLNTTNIVSLPVVQRSQFILLLQLVVQGGRQRLMAYTSLPSRTKAPLGTWNEEQFYNRGSLFLQRYLNFAGKILNVPVSCYDQPFMYMNEDLTECLGANLDALQVIGDQYNFTAKANPRDVVWGTKVNGTWTGMLGNLMYGDGHVVISSMRLNPDRFEDFDFVYPYWRYNFATILRIPPPMPRSKNILYPFSTMTWGLIIMTTIISASILAIMVQHLHHVNDPLDIALKVMSGLLGQAMNDRRVKVFPWARVWLIFWWLSVDILAAAYMSNLMSVLTVPVYPKRIQTVKELVESDLIPSMTDYGGFVPEALKTSTNPVYKALGDKLFLEPMKLPELHTRLMTGVANNTHTVTDSIDYTVFLQHNHDMANITYLMDEKMYQDHMAWFLRRNTPYTSLISSSLHRLVETGILGKIYQTHMSTFTFPNIRERGDGVLTLDHLQGAFIIIGPCFAVATLIFFLERLLAKA